MKSTAMNLLGFLFLSSIAMAMAAQSLHRARRQDDTPTKDKQKDESSNQKQKDPVTEDDLLAESTATTLDPVTEEDLLADNSSSTSGSVIEDDFVVKENPASTEEPLVEVSPYQKVCRTMTRPGVKVFESNAPRCGQENGFVIDAAVFQDFDVKLDTPAGSDFLTYLLTYLGIPEDIYDSFRECILQPSTQKVKNFITYHASIANVRFDTLQFFFSAVDGCRDQPGPFECYEEACINFIRSAKEDVISW